MGSESKQRWQHPMRSTWQGRVLGWWGGSGRIWGGFLEVTSNLGFEVQKVKVLVSQPCVTLCDPLDYRLSLLCHRILQARRLEWVAIPFSRGSSQCRDWTWVSHIAGRFFTVWNTRKADKKLGNISITQRTERSFWPYELSWRQHLPYEMAHMF